MSSLLISSKNAKKSVQDDKNKTHQLDHFVEKLEFSNFGLESSYSTCLSLAKRPRSLSVYEPSLYE
jgi:hypothetical protein